MSNNKFNSKQRFPTLSINILNCPSDQHRIRNSNKVRLYKVLQVFHNFSKISNNYLVNSFANQQPSALLGLGWDRGDVGRRYGIFLFFSFWLVSI